MRLTYSLATAAVSACIALSATSANARCTGFADQISMVKTLAGAVCGGIPVAGQYCDIAKSAAKTAGLPNNAKKALKEWNSISNNGPGKIGPRSLDIGARPDHGKVVTPGKRLWITNAVANGTVTVTIKHTAKDKSRVVAELCAVDANGGKPRWVDKIEFGKKTAKGKKKSAKVALKNEALFIDVIPKTLGRSFTYDISVTQ